jgi:hypothetical protein
MRKINVSLQGSMENELYSQYASPEHFCLRYGILGLCPIPAGVSVDVAICLWGTEIPGLSCSAPENGKEYVGLDGSAIRTPTTGGPGYPLTGDIGVERRTVWTGCWR